MPANEIDAVIEPTVRGSNTDKVNGTGLGLSLVSRIAAADGGRLDIEGVEGSGTKARVSLPCAGPQRRKPLPGYRIRLGTGR
ncbi:sensor histidine kinase [Martelella soudanensis]|uniref:sensor histidine kinase n=1 Tax=unclassified Martelella TaxID=2629616 RepID=UPI0015DDE574